MLEVILTDEVVKLGSKGDVVRVSPGYARNYLYPKQLAIPATAANKTQIAEMQAAADREAEHLKGDADKMADALSGLNILITARAGETDQLFGSVTSRDIAAELEELGYTIDRHKILIDQPIRTVGKHAVKVHLHRDIDLPLTVRVVAEGREHELDEEQEPVEESAGETAENMADTDTRTENESLDATTAETEVAQEAEADQEAETEVAQEAEAEADQEAETEVAQEAEADQEAEAEAGQEADGAVEPVEAPESQTGDGAEK